MRALVWFRADLRVRDNTALWHACRAAENGVIGVFLLAPSQWREHDWGAAKVRFLLRNVRALQDELSRLNIPLLIRTADRFADAPRVLAELAAKHRCNELFFNREYELNERRRDDTVTKHLGKAGILVHAYTDQTIFEPGHIKTGQGTGGWYTVFTPFKRTCLAELDKHPSQVLGLPRAQPAMPCDGDPVSESLEGFEPTQVPDTTWTAGESHALRQLDTFVGTQLAKYGQQRDFPAIDGTSRLSPYLAAGVLSPRQCLAAAVASTGTVRSPASLPDGSGAAVWVSELLWREFYKHILVGFPRVCMGRAFKPETERLHWRNDPADLAAWKQGRTGVPIVDAGMRQLLREGWMHNRLRMLTTMYLTKDLFIDWREGERHFMQNLVDGDLAANNGGWQWSSSTGTDAAPYFRIFNPATQSRKFDPRGEYIRRYVPELASLSNEDIHEPWLLPPLARQRLEYPEPIVDHAVARNRVISAFQKLKPA